MKNYLPLFLAGTLACSSGCGIFHSIDRTLTRFSDSLAEREQQKPEALFRKKGYRFHVGDDVVPPVHTSTVTNILRQVTFSYVFNPLTQDPKHMYLVISREFRDVLGDPFHQERYCIYPAGFTREDRPAYSLLYTTLAVDDWEKGKYLYEWWQGMPPDKDPSLLNAMRSSFSRESKLLLEGYLDHQ